MLSRSILKDGATELAMFVRDWLQIKTELDELRPGHAERENPPALSGERTGAFQPPNDDDSILKHIADALRTDDQERR